jgi:hypothetical protein
MFKKCFFFIICLLSQTISAHQHELAICAVFQNEAPYLKEWIEFHRLQGATHFYLFNNLSEDNYRSVLKEYVKKGIVTLIDWPYTATNNPEWDHIQIKACELGRQLACGKAKWLALLDIDEFLFATSHTSFVEFLRLFENVDPVGGICVNWVVYGTSHVEKIPPNKLLIETLVLSSGHLSDHFKSIIRPERVAYVCSPHYAIYQPGYRHYTVSDAIPFPPFMYLNQARINHYWPRDLDYLERVKIPRRIKWGTPLEVSKLWAEAANNHYDTSIFPYIEPLRKKVFD